LARTGQTEIGAPEQIVIGVNSLAVPKDADADADIWALIFEPGFSTASEVTDISGRGVGMDVVRQSILDLGGRCNCKPKRALV